MKKKLQALATLGRQNLARVGVAAAVALPMFSHATGTDYTTLTASVDYTGVIAAIMAVAALVVGLYLTMSGVKIILRTIRGVV